MFLPGTDSWVTYLHESLRAILKSVHNLTSTEVIVSLRENFPNVYDTQATKS